MNNLSTTNYYTRKYYKPGDSLVPRWYKLYPMAIQCFVKELQIATYDRLTNMIVIDTYKTENKFNQEVNYCRLWAKGHRLNYTVDVV